MRASLLLGVGLCLAACQSLPPPTAATHGAFVDASFTQGSRAPVQHVHSLEPVMADLIGALLETYRVRSRIAIENLANVDTPGFKRRIVQIVTEGLDSSGQSPRMPVVDRVDSDFSMGALEITERSLDLAIDGPGFFSVLRRDGQTGYTRDGRVQVSAEGKLMIAGGISLIPEVTIPSDALDVHVSPDGHVGGRTAGSPDTLTMFGQLLIHRFVNPGGLPLEGRLYRPSEESGQPITGTPGSRGLGPIKQGFLERSNVQVAVEMMRLQELQQRHATMARVLEPFGMIAP